MLAAATCLQFILSTMAAVINTEGLVPNTLDPNAVFATSNNVTEHRNPVNDYKKAVQMVLENPADKESLTKALQEFKSTMIVEELIDNLKEILDEPNKRILYKYISPLIPGRLRQEYKSLVPHIPGFEKKIIRLKQTGNQPFGFSVRGGKEFGCGIFVVKVMPSSKAAQNNLKPGDQIIRINGLTLSESTHKEFIDLVKLRKSLALTVKSVGLIPDTKVGSSKVTWRSIGETKSWVSRTRIGIHGPIKKTKRIHVNLQRGESLGANVKTSTAIDGGVLIVDVNPHSPALAAGLKAGDEILEVNGRSLIGIPHEQAIGILKSSNTLMMTIRADRVMSRDSTGLSEFDFTTHDHDTDAQLLSSLNGQRFLSAETFVLKERHDDEGAGATTKKTKKQKTKKTSTASNRISVLDTEVVQQHNAPVIAKPAAFGHGPSIAMPTFQNLTSQTNTVNYPDTEFPPSMGGGSHQRDSSYGGESQQNSQSSRPMSGHRLSTPIPPSIGSVTVDGDKAPTTTTATKNTRKVSSESQQQDLSQYQFPVDNDEQNGRKTSAIKKSSSTSVMKNRKPTFNADVEIIPEREPEPKISNSKNYTFSEEILNGRKVAVHNIPKNGPLRLAIRGGKDTPLGSQIIISRIMEDGMADRYGKLNIGDQILVIDGISLIDVTHDYAGQLFKQAMERDSQCIELVVAVNPEMK